MHRAYVDKLPRSGDAGFQLFALISAGAFLGIWPLLLVDQGMAANGSGLVVGTFVAIGGTAAGMILLDAARGMLLNLTHWTFVYVFLFLAPLVQWSEDAFPLGSISANDYGALGTTNLIILVWMMHWALGRTLGSALRPPRVGAPRVSIAGFRRTAILSLVSVSVLTYLVGLEGLLVRGAYDLSDAIANSSLRLVADKLLRGFTVAAAAGYVVYRKKLRKGHKRFSVVGIGVLALLLVANSPFGAPRYWVASVYLGLLFSLVRTRRRSGWLLLAALLVGIVTVFVVLGGARGLSDVGDLSLLWPKSLSVKEALLKGSFDAYSQLVRTWLYVADGPGVTYGRQLVGALLFWIPRSLWPGKPIGTGKLVAMQQGLEFTNLSSPLAGEGLVNFGWVGVGMFALAAGMMTTLIDRSVQNCRDETSWLRTIYPFWIGFAFFMLRGDLMSSLAYLVGFSVAMLPLIGDAKSPPKTGHQTERT